jgi:hypothetical protein
MVQLQKEYIEAGSNVIYAPTFGANRVKLEENGIFNQVGDFNRRLVVISKKAVASAGKDALIAGDIETFFENVKASGRSSFCYLQNVYTTKNVSEQGLSLALCLAEKVLGEKSAAWRVHGGGFAGTIQAFVRTEDVAEFKSVIDSCFGEGACMVLNIRPVGAARVI